MQAVAKGAANGDEMIERWKKYLLRNRYVAVASAIIIALATLLSGITGAARNKYNGFRLAQDID